MKKLYLAAFIFILAASVGGSAKEKKRETDVKRGYDNICSFNIFVIKLNCFFIYLHGNLVKRSKYEYI
jgi:hypothetical protein